MPKKDWQANLFFSYKSILVSAWFSSLPLISGARDFWVVRERRNSSTNCYYYYHLCYFFNPFIVLFECLQNSRYFFPSHIWYLYLVFPTKAWVKLVVKKHSVTSGLPYWLLNSKKDNSNQNSRQNEMSQKFYRRRQLKFGYQINFLKGRCGKTSLFNMQNCTKPVYSSVLETSRTEQLSVGLFRCCTSSTVMNHIQPGVHLNLQRA